MKALVTGGAGFLGSHLCESLLDDGYHVHCIDNLQTGNLDNIIHLMNNKKFKFSVHNVQISMLKFEADEYWNLACPASPIQYQKDSIDTLLTNVIGVKNVLETALLHKAKVFQASTSEVYGDPTVTPQSESYRGNVNPIGPRACYDEGKRAAETLLSDYHRQYKIETRIARIFNTYGPNLSDDDGRVVSNFIKQAITGADITVYGDGSQTRSFCYVSDMIRGFRLLMNSEYTTPVNLGNPNEITVLELARLIIDMTKSKSKIVFKPLPVDDPLQRVPDIIQAGAVLGWEPCVNLERGLDLTIQFFRTKNENLG